MKKIAILSFIFLTFFLSVSLAQDVKAKDDKIKVKDKGDNKTGKSVTGNYTAVYSSDFQIGSSAYAQKVMDIWQDWDDNMLDRHISYFSDTMTMNFADGSMITGKTENLTAAKKYRGTYASVKTDLHALVPLRSNDKNQDVVAVWGQENNTYPDGKVEKKAIHEVWFFNSAGQIVRMRQWVADVK